MSIVGARRSTRYGENIAYKTAYQLAKKGFVIVSGMAYGIDACAHRGCLDAGGTTVAVLGTAIDKIYPRCNTALAERILEKGAIISEYPPASETRAWHFLYRNRLVSGLCDALLVTEAAKHSGTLTTAALALNQSKELFIVPGDITRPMSVGCNRLWQQGAYPYFDVDDILECVAPSQTAKREAPNLNYLSSDERAIYQQIADGVHDGEQIIQNLKMEAPNFSYALTMLEIQRCIVSLGANQWRLA